MADENKTEQSPDALENLSPEELQERIQEEKKNAKRSLRFAFTALIAIIAVCIAWFAANNQVTMTGTQISAENDEPFEIASTGNSRLEGEEKYLKDENNNNILSDGTAREYKKYIDTDTGEEITLETPRIFYTGGSGVAWHMTGGQSLVPGAGGKLEFYLIPKKEGLTQVTVSLSLEGYALDADKGKVSKIDKPKIQSLLNGHILFFQQVDDTYGYHGWLGENKSLTITAPKIQTTTSDADTSATFEKNIPYKVTLYWKWPQYFRNYIYTDRSGYGDLFTDAMKKTYSTEYDSLVKFVNNQKNVTDKSSKLFYDTEKQGTISGAINADMSDAVLDACNSYYNQADEYIGTNTQYVYIQINVN